MPGKKGGFQPFGEFAKQIVFYLIQKANEAKESGINASEGDFSWDTFRSQNDSLCQAIAEKHPGGQSDNLRLCRNNFNTQKKRFTDWLASGRGKQKPCSAFVAASDLL